MKIKLALRDEKINILSMTLGGVSSKCLYQKHPLLKDRLGPFLLDMKKRNEITNYL